MRTKIAAVAVTAALAGSAGAALVLPTAAGAQSSTTTPTTVTTAPGATAKANRHADVLKGLVSSGTLTQAQAKQLANQANVGVPVSIASGVLSAALTAAATYFFIKD